MTARLFVFSESASLSPAQQGNPAQEQRPADSHRAAQRRRYLLRIDTAHDDVAISVMLE